MHTYVVGPMTEYELPDAGILCFVLFVLFCLFFFVNLMCMNGSLFLESFCMGLISNSQEYMNGSPFLGKLVYVWIQFTSLPNTNLSYYPSSRVAY